MRATVLALIIALAAAPAAPAAQRVDLELALAIDVSGSIDEEEARLQRKGYVEAFTSPEVISAIRSGFLKRIAVTYFEWAGYDHHQRVVGWSLISDARSAAAFAGALAEKQLGIGPYTSISGAISYAMPLFEKNGYEGTRQVIDISGDGPNNSGRLVTLARAEALRAGFTINGLPIINTRPSRYGNPPMPNLDLYYRKCVIGGPRSFIVVAEDFRSFAKAIRKKLVLEIAGAEPPARARARYLASSVRSLPPPRRAARNTPACDAGEMRHQSWSTDY